MNQKKGSGRSPDPPAKTPVIRECTVTKCAYNMDNQCHTPGITVGEGTDPVCDTFVCDVCVKTVDKGGTRKTEARVGACKVEVCEHNKSLECDAHGIVVDVQREKPECDTFQPSEEKKVAKKAKESIHRRIRT